MKKLLIKLLSILAYKRPFSFLYNTHRQLIINELLGRQAFSGDNLPIRYGAGIDERVIEYPWLFWRLPNSEGRLLDAGSTLNFDFILKNNKLKNKELYIYTLAPEKNCYWKRGISYIYGDLRATCFSDEYFDYIVCVSVLEHVGMDTSIYGKYDEKRLNDESYIGAINELKRIIKRGGRLFFTMPYGLKSDYGWLRVFDGEMVDKIKMEFMPSELQEFYYMYENGYWRVCDKNEASLCLYNDIHEYKTSYDKNGPVAAGAMVCLELVK